MNNNNFRSNYKILDLYCGDGGAGKGFELAGFEVTGVDLYPKPRYPFKFHQSDALEFLADHWTEYDAIHASPPCQAVYNAAIGTVSRFLDLTPAHVQAMLDVNCRGMLAVVHALAPAMVARGRGGIVLLSSMSGNFGSEQLAVYAATKAFALVFGEALWAELQPAGVDVLVVQPGSTRTPGWQSSQPSERRGPGPHVMVPGPVVAEALDALGGEPSLVPGRENREGAELLARLPRRQAVELMSRLTRTLCRTGESSRGPEGAARHARTTRARD